MTGVHKIRRAAGCLRVLSIRFGAFKSDQIKHVQTGLTAYAALRLLLGPGSTASCIDGKTRPFRSVYITLRSDWILDLYYGSTNNMNDLMAGMGFTDFQFSSGVRDTCTPYRMDVGTPAPPALDIVPAPVHVPSTEG